MQWRPLELARWASPVDSTRWHAVATLASEQHGLIAAWQLEVLGVPHSTWCTWLRTGHLHLIRRGVHAVGHRSLTETGRLLGAVLACGPGSAVTAGAAIALRGMGYAGLSPIAVIAPRDGDRRHAGIDFIRSGTLVAADLTTIDNVPSTSLPRALLDLSARVGEGELREIVARAQRRNLLGADGRAQLDELVQRSRGRRGIRALREVAADLRPVGGVARAGLEQRFLRLCERFGVPEPEVNFLIHLEHRSIQADFAWPDAWLVVETDGRGSHSDLISQEEDPRRDQELIDLGWTVLRFTYRQVKVEPARVARLVRRRLQSASAQNDRPEGSK